MLSTLRSIRVHGQYRNCKSIFNHSIIDFYGHCSDMYTCFSKLAIFQKLYTQLTLYRVLLTCVFLIACISNCRASCVFVTFMSKRYFFPMVCPCLKI